MFPGPPGGEGRVETGDTSPPQLFYINHETFKLLAECVALWGKPEQAVHGTIERTATASSDVKGKRATI